MWVKGLIGAAVAGALLAGCAMEPPKPLYDRLGGQPALVAVVDDFTANVAADPRINKFFGETNIPRFKRLLVEQLCEATGGPCKYTGRTMRESHPTKMGVKDEHFTALVEDLVKTLTKFNVPAAEQQELLGILGPMKPDMTG